MPKLADPICAPTEVEAHLNKANTGIQLGKGKYWYSQCSPTVDLKGKHIHSVQ